MFGDVICTAAHDGIKNGKPGHEVSSFYLIWLEHWLKELKLQSVRCEHPLIIKRHTAYGIEVFLRSAELTKLNKPSFALLVRIRTNTG